jgi:hypothetical protein
MQMLYDHDWIPILNIVKVIGLGPGNFSNNGHLGPLSNRRWVKKLLLEGEETSV